MVWTLSLIFLWLIAHCNIQISTVNMTTCQLSNYTADNVVSSSERAIDEKVTQCAHTLEMQNPWWRIDLFWVYNISCISIYVIEDKAIDLNGTQVYIGNSREKNGTTNNMCTTITDFHQVQWNNYTFNSSVSGRYVTVISWGNQFLALCEVKLYGTKKDSPFVLVQENKTWEEALYYCRDKHIDLASIVDNDTQAWAELEAKKANTSFVWLGLHYTCTLDFWSWVDDQQVQISHWAMGNKTEECDRSGAMETQEEHLWFSKSDYMKFYFICAT